VKHISFIPLLQKIVASEIGFATSIAAALLHDVVEDTPTTIQDIERLFNKGCSTR
jgi:(p)ppGpp synthase/HD superfamily hydrolase